MQYKVRPNLNTIDPKSVAKIQVFLTQGLLFSIYCHGYIECGFLVENLCCFFYFIYFFNIVVGGVFFKTGRYVFCLFVCLFIFRFKGERAGQVSGADVFIP